MPQVSRTIFCRRPSCIEALGGETFPVAFLRRLEKLYCLSTSPSNGYTQGPSSVVATAPRDRGRQGGCPVNASHQESPTVTQRTPETVGPTVQSPIRGRAAGSRTLWMALLLSALALSGCNCKEDPANDKPSNGCTSDAECIAEHDDRWFCRDGECIQGPRYCEEEGDVACCPGQRCSRHGVCLDNYSECSDDEDCRIAGQVCLPRLVNGAEQDVCTFALCENGECPGDLYCFAGFCVGENPCGGGCPSGEACVPSNNSCHPAPMCDETCPEGSILTFGDPHNVDDGCDMDSLFCICEALPPLTTRDTGRHSSLAMLPDGSLAISAYNGDFGDLVVAYFDGAGSLTGTDWVDGIPANAPVVANPAGPRQGIGEPGPDVGRYTSIAAAQGGTLHISYYDRTDGRLKYARRDAGEWTTHVVDEDGDVGRYSSIALTQAGVPTIAYFRRRGLDEERFVTALKVARATTITPGGPDDWSIIVVESAAVTPPPCDGDCPSGQRCVDDGDGSSCHAPVSGCDDCPDGHVCVDLGDGPTCRERLGTTALEDLPDGTGLFPSLVIPPDGTAAVAYYEKLPEGGRLKLAANVDPRTDESGTTHVLDSAEGEDLGRFPSATVDDSGAVVVAYQDAGHGRVLWTRANLSGDVVDSGVVDDGTRDPTGDSLRLVGMDNALVIAADGRWMIAYQDGTAGELLLSIGSGDGWDRQPIATEGAVGFWVDAALGGGDLYVSHAEIKAEPNRPVTTRLRVEVLRP